jgi:hypothetical protein
MLGLTEIELTDRRDEPGIACRTTEDLSELLRNVRVLAARCGHHVQDRLPDLVQAIQPGPPPPLQDLVEARRTGFEDEDAHRATLTGRDWPKAEKPLNARPSALA